MIIALAAADVNIAGVAIPMALYDCGGQLFQVSSSYRVAGLDAKARARLNGCVLLSMFIGQVSTLSEYVPRNWLSVIDLRHCDPDQDIQ
jgi:hypothetical protein